MRVMIATVTAGAGHLAAAAAVEESWKMLRPEDAVETVDLLDFASRLYRQVYTRTLLKVVEDIPELYGMVFKKTDQSRDLRKLNSFRRTFAHQTNRGFVKYLKGTKPDILLCSHYLPLEILGALRIREEGPHPFCGCMVTDFEAHAFWLEPAIDLYCVAAEETKASLIARGASADKVVVTGIPIAARFSQPLDAVEIRKRYGLRDDLSTLLVLGGGFGLGPVGEILQALDGLKGHLQILVVAGRNEELRAKLAVRDWSHPTHILGFISNMQELMGISDLIITKPGGLTCSEALALGKPMCIFNPIPGQETANSDFLLERGAAVKVNRVEDLPFRVEQLLGSTKLRDMARASKILGRPDAARDVCRATLEKFPLRDPGKAQGISVRSARQVLPLKSSR